MKHPALTLALLLLSWAQAPGPTSPPKKQVQLHAQGCIEAGVEANCLVLKDLKSGSLFNLLIKGIRPAIGDGIEFVGTPHQGPSTCMQGIDVDVITWSPRESIRCKPAHANRK
jgi:hypothetical protein